MEGKTLDVADGVSSGGEFPLLVKLLFPDEKLSVQVHPDDAQAQAAGEAEARRSAGMCWRRSRALRWRWD